MDHRPYILHYAPDNASLVVRLALEELALPFQTHLVDRRQAAQRAPAHLALNPAGLIPALETPDGPLFETGAILLWLADRHGRLAPAPDSPDRGDLLKWLFYLSNTLHPALRRLFYPTAHTDDNPSHQTSLRAKARESILTHVQILNSHWRPTAEPTVLDLYVAPMLRWVQLYPQDSDRSWFDLSAFPALHHVASRLESRDSTKAAQVAEGLGPTPFTAPQAPNPPEGSAL